MVARSPSIRSTRSEQRLRRLRGSAGLQAPQSPPIRGTPLEEPLDDFFFDQSYAHALGAARPHADGSPSGQVVNLDARRKIATLPIAGMPHLGSGITFDWNGTRVLASPNLQDGTISAEDSPLKHAPHTQADLLEAEWNRAYSRETGAFPSAAQKAWKYWPAVNRVDNVYGDRNFVCSCPPIEDYVGA